MPDRHGDCPVCDASWEADGPCRTCGLVFTDCMGPTEDLAHDPVSWTRGYPPVEWLDSCPRCTGLRASS